MELKEEKEVESRGGRSENGDNVWNNGDSGQIRASSVAGGGVRVREMNSGGWSEI